MSLPDTLHTNLFYFIVIGPVTGETVLLRIPFDQWIIIDSFKCARNPAADFVVRKYGGRVACIVLTHPHQDHYSGILELIDNHGDAVLGCVHPKDGGPNGSLSVDAMTALRQRSKPTYVRIWDEWQANESRRWDTFRHTERIINDAKVTSLHPERPVDSRSWSNDPNEISSAMLVEWHGLKLLLGADVPNTKWPDIAAAFPSLGGHAAMKVPHHGSREAIHLAFGEGSPKRFWVVTPFRKGKEELPRANDVAANPANGPEGLAKILSHVEEIKMTSLPFRHDRESEGPCVTTRQEIQNGQRPCKTGVSDEGLTKTTAALDRHVIVAFDKTGGIRDVHYGPGSVLVKRA